MKKEQMSPRIRNGLIGLVAFVAIVLLFRFALRLDVVLNIYLGKWYIAYCALIAGAIAGLIYGATRHEPKPWIVLLIPFAFMGIFLLMRIWAALGGTPSGGGAPFFDTTDPATMDFWHYILTGELN